MSKYVFGVDVGGTTVKLGLFCEDGRLMDKWEIPTDKRNGGSAILPDVANSILAKMQEKGIAKSDVAGVGIDTPGPVNEEGVVNKAENLGWGVTDVPGILKKYLDFPIKSGNDANVAAFGEMWQGGGKGYRNLVVVTLGTGVGGGIIINGKILTGAMGAGGEIGHMHVEDQETVPCNCGLYGCLEQYASATGIARLARRRLEKDDAPSILRDSEITAKAVFDAVKAGDNVAVEIAEEFGDYLGKGLSQIAAVVNPEVFVIGGGVSKAGEILFDFIRPAFKKYAFHACRETDMVLATLGNDAGIYGAAGLFLNENN